MSTTDQMPDSELHKHTHPTLVGIAKKRGRRYGIISVVIGLVIAYLIMAFFYSADQGFPESLFWVVGVEYKFNIAVGMVIMLLCGALYGQNAGKAILISGRRFYTVGPLCGVAVLLTTGLLSGLPGFLLEGLKEQTAGESFIDYICKPFYWITLLGWIPALLVGLWFGYRIKQTRVTSLR